MKGILRVFMEWRGRQGPEGSHQVLRGGWQEQEQENRRKTN